MKFLHLWKAKGQIQDLMGGGGGDVESGVEGDELLRALRAFENQRLKYVLIGPTVMDFHELPRRGRSSG